MFCIIGSRSFATAENQQYKNYYHILGVEPYASENEIKEAYRALAKRHHPDVRATDSDALHDPDVEKFRDIVEAYQVLSVNESRTAFDLSRKRNPHLYKPDVQADFEMMNNRDARDKRGLSPRSKPARGSYAEERLATLAKERAKYNVNHLGYYNGGVPRKDRGVMRGDALGEPGSFHSPQVHNYLHYQHADSYRVTPQEA